MEHHPGLEFSLLSLRHAEDVALTPVRRECDADGVGHPLAPLRTEPGVLDGLSDLLPDISRAHARPYRVPDQLVDLDDMFERLEHVIRRIPQVHLGPLGRVVSVNTAGDLQVNHLVGLQTPSVPGRVAHSGAGARMDEYGKAGVLAAGPDLSPVDLGRDIVLRRSDLRRLDAGQYSCLDRPRRLPNIGHLLRRLDDSALFDQIRAVHDGCRWHGRGQPLQIVDRYEPGLLLDANSLAGNAEVLQSLLRPYYPVLRVAIGPTVFDPGQRLDVR